MPSTVAAGYEKNPLFIEKNTKNMNSRRYLQYKHVLCISIDATALKLPRPHRTYSAALTPQQLSCSSYAASFLLPHSRRSLHGAASMLQLSHPCIHAAALVLQHSRLCILSPLSRLRIDAVSCHSIFMPPNSRLRMHSAIFYSAACTPPHSRRSHAAALMQSLSRGTCFTYVYIPERGV